jgi:hypothetical protein
MFVIDGLGVGIYTATVKERLLEERVTWLFAGSCRRRITEHVMSARHCKGIGIAGVMRKQQAVLPRMAWHIVAIVQQSVLSRAWTKCVKHF